MAKSNAQRQRDFLERKLLGIKLPTCKYCGTKLNNKTTRKRQICSYCFPPTVEGKEANRERQQKYLNKQKENNEKN